MSVSEVCDSDGSDAGRFSFDGATDTWRWDDQVFRIHGLAPGSVTPTTELVLRSKHPDDRERVRLMLKEVLQTSMSCSMAYRLVREDGSERRVVLVGKSTVTSASARFEGFYLDLTAEFDEETEDATRSAFETLEQRAVIEQAKGILMMVYGIDDQAAFAMLRWWSRNRNTKVRDLAQRLVTTVREDDLVPADAKTSVDALLHDITAG